MAQGRRVVELDRRARWRVSSFTDGRRKYVVSRSKDGVWSCACPRWIFQRGPAHKRKACKHVVRVQLTKRGLRPQVAPRKAA